MEVADLIGGLEALCRDVAIPSLRTLGVTADRYEALLEKMAQDALDSGSPAFNPRVPTRAEVISLYREIY
jgi:alcohol dehydrogenase class IV